MKISISKTVGQGYNRFWHFKGRYRVVKGSRASKKSKTIALWIIYNMMKYPDSNTLVIRKTFRTLKDSCYTDLKWAINRLHVQKFWSCKESPLEMTYKETGQKIYFRGCDDPLKIASIAVDKGVLCWAWIEEAYEITKESDFDMIDESIRGEVPEGLFKQITLSFNPWNEKHWIKHKFFDEVIGKDSEGNPIYKQREGPISDDGRIMAITTNYKCNEWLDDDDRALFEIMKVKNPKRYEVAGKGNWGVVEGLVYENWREESFNIDTVKNIKNIKEVYGLDFGFTNDATALFCGYLDLADRRIYVYDEIYKTGLTNAAIQKELITKEYAAKKIVADSAAPKDIAELKALNVKKITGAKKGKDSINNGIQYIQNFEIIVHPRCVNFLTEISNYQWSEDKFGNKLNVPVDDQNHLMDAMRYAIEEYIPKGKWII